MIRLHEVFLSLAAAGIMAALVMSGRTGGEDRGWDPRESQAGLFHSQDAGSIRSSHLSTGPTLRKWAGTGFAPQVRVATFKPGHVRGVRVSLTSSPDMATAIQGMSQGPDIPSCFGTFVSVKTGTTQLSPCSSQAGGNSQSCSVKQTGTGSTCSTVAATGGSYCSTGASSGSGTCSVQNSSNNKCSAQLGGSDSCSTQSDQTNNNTTTCSVNGNGGGGLVLQYGRRRRWTRE
jgi:hypothetical protein